MKELLIKPLKAGRFRVVDRETGDVVVSSAVSPEFKAARELVKRGYRGRVRTYAPTGTVSMEGDVEVWAGLNTEERSKGGLRIIPYRPAEVTIARPESAD